jgi:GAF domain-containing protein
MEQFITHRLNACRDMPTLIDCLLHECKSITGASMGNVQLMNWADRSLTIAARSGFEDEFLNFFRRVRLDGGSVCAQALSRRAEVSVEDVRHDGGCLPYGAIFSRAGVCGVHSVPLITDGDALVGMVSVHFAEPMKLNAAQRGAMRRLASLTANRILRLTAETNDRSLIKSSVSAIKESRETLALADKTLGRW